MLSEKPGLYTSLELLDAEGDEREVKRLSECISSQSAGIALTCALALESLASDEELAHEVAGPVGEACSKLLYTVYNDLQTALSVS